MKYRILKHLNEWWLGLRFQWALRSIPDDVLAALSTYLKACEECHTAGKRRYAIGDLRGGLFMMGVAIQRQNEAVKEAVKGLFPKDKVFEKVEYHTRSAEPKESGEVTTVFPGFTLSLIRTPEGKYLISTKSTKP